MKTPKTELQITQPETLPTAMQEIAQKSGIVITEAQSIAIKFAPYMATVNEHAQIIAGIEKTNPTEADAKLAREHRLKLVANRGKNGMDIVHIELKAGIVIKGKLIDNLYNLVENTSKLSEIEAEAIEKHQERLEEKRKAELAATRIELLLPFGTDTTYLPLNIMTEEQWDRLYANEQLLFSARKEAEDKAEQARVEAELAAEQARLAAIEADRITREEQAKENERLRVENEAKEKQLQAEREAAAKENQRLADLAEKERMETYRTAEKLAKENAAKLAEQQRLAKIEADKQAAELAKQKAAADKLAAELQAKQAAEDARLAAEKARIEAEEADRLAKEKAALNADDKEKVRTLHTTLKAIEIPKFTTAEGIAIGKTMKEALDILIKELVQDSKKFM